MKGGLRSSAVPPNPSSVFKGLGASGEETPPTVLSGILGGSVTFPLNISRDAEIEHVTWSFPPKSLALAMSKKDIIILEKEYTGRLSISGDGYSLYMSNLTKNDSGSYKAQINQKNVFPTRKKEFTLSIYGESQSTWGDSPLHTTTKPLLISNNAVSDLPKPMSSSYAQYIYPIPSAPKVLLNPL